MTEAEVTNLFTYHTPTGGQPERYEKIREKARQMAMVILENTPGCPDQTVAIRKLRETVMTANASIALEGGVPATSGPQGQMPDERRASA